ncbi:MAG: hypothetical protein L0Z50_40675, partial [Verrucomicrobiales bacterium]|nr:hypothetical protein [Verrucomicrobiales bacterium]
MLGRFGYTPTLRQDGRVLIASDFRAVNCRAKKGLHTLLIVLAMVAHRGTRTVLPMLSAATLAVVPGCSISSTQLSSGLGNNLSLQQGTSKLGRPIPTDTSKPKVAVFLANVECNALITGRPLELARHVRTSMVQHLASS